MIGDGDHGEGMKRGCEALIKLLEANQYDYVDDLCYAVSIELIRTMGGASGIIFGTMFFGGIDCLGHQKDVTASQLADYFCDGEQEIERRGKSKPGQKTMLDALYPACMEMKKAASETENIKEVLTRGYKAAIQGVEDSKNLRSRIGRSKNFKEKTLGLPDPGAVSVSFWFEGFQSIINEQ
ncbi:MAG: dihydroxyacetone kinase subunit L [Blautia sp.]